MQNGSLCASDLREESMLDDAKVGGCLLAGTDAGIGFGCALWRHIALWGSGCLPFLRRRCELARKLDAVSLSTGILS